MENLAAFGSDSETVRRNGGRDETSRKKVGETEKQTRGEREV
jgi:hypothetical protein